ncbi:penicillin-binding protein 1A [Sphingomicrobium nitratireducens]|uniref:penicillin-binding protein 1A n=1 Tax=Sphingomicrobium nitratireducens TaxID=2964666 RepID=UPI00223EBECE|nr:transglycosylase domain-containing protein [Sphingomicrobium nitratireducens]
MNVPRIPLPDLVAFNERVRSRVAPLFARRWVRRLALIGAAGFLLVAVMWVFIATKLPTSEDILAYEPALPTMVRGHDGDPIATYARERRVSLAYEDYPDLVVEAFISAEDKTFFSHGGIDYPALIKAVFNYTAKSVVGGGRTPGGSTITQQVAKHFLGDDSYSPVRKVREAILAFRIESTLTKQEIISLYLNQIFLGRNAYGVQAASRAYFDKDVDELDLHEAAYLAAIPKGPSNYHPVRNKAKATARRNYVLREMADNGFITEAERARASSIELTAIPQGSASPFRERGGYFLEEVRRRLLADYGEEAKDGENSVYAGGLWVRTSMDPRMQDAAAEAMREQLARFDGGKGWRDLGMSIDMSQDWQSQLRIAAVGTGFPDWKKAVVLEKDGRRATIGFADGTTASLPRSAATQPKRGGGGAAFDHFREGMIIVVKDVGNGSYALRSIPEVSGGFVAEEVATGRVLAMQGGFDVLGSSYNRATQAKRQPGSAFKPIVYLTALENGFTPASIIVDAPFCVWQGAGLGEKCFRNFDGKYAGPKTLRWGVEQSRNLMTVRTANQTGMGKIVANAKKLGVGEYEPYISMALGAGDTTVLNLTNAYAILANQGREVKPTLIDYVQDRRGKVVYRADNRCALMDGCNAKDYDGKAMPRPPSRARQLVDPQAAFQMVNVMTGVVQRGTAIRLAALDMELFGKTGTTSGPTNVWFVGGTQEIVTGTYVGYDDNRKLGGYAQGGNTAGPVFMMFAEKVLKDRPKIPFRAPEGIRMVRIDRRTGLRVFGEFPTSEEKQSAVIWEAFKPETEPRRSWRARIDEDEDDTPKRASPDAANPRPQARPQRPAQPADDDFLQRQGGIY